MAFYRTDPADLTALKTLVSGTPALANEGNTQNLLDLLNTASNNPGGETGPAPMSAEDLLEIIFSENVSAGNQFRIQALFETTATLTDDLSRFKTMVSLLDAGISTKIAALIRPLSRVEVLFSDLDVNGVNEFVVISRDDWIAARDS